MQQFKLDNYQQVSKKKLDIESLDSFACKSVIRSLLFDLAVEDDANQTLFQLVSSGITDRTDLSSIDTDHGFKDLENIIADKIKFKIPNYHLIWNVNEVDWCSTEVLESCWDFIWYGVGDEVLLLYVPSVIIVVIHDWGEVGIKVINKS